MNKKILSLAVALCFLFSGFCFASGISVSESESYLQKISDYWSKTLSWIDSDLKPWIGEHIGEKTREEFSKEFSEALGDVPEAASEIWSYIKGIFN